MGRSVASIRQEANDIADRWAGAARAAGEGPCGRRLAGLAKRHASDAFFGCDEPLEAAVFSALVELLKASGSAGPGKAADMAEVTGATGTAAGTGPAGGGDVDS